MKIVRYCAECDKKIPVQRLKALPDTNLCVKCSEKVGGDYEVIVVDEDINNPLIYRKPRYVD